MFYYLKSLSVRVQYDSARKPLRELIQKYGQDDPRSADAAFMGIHGVLLTRTNTEMFRPLFDEFASQLDNNLSLTSEFGYYIAIANACAIVGYGNRHNVIWRAIRLRMTTLRRRKDSTWFLWLSTLTLDTRHSHETTQRSSIAIPSCIPRVHLLPDQTPKRHAIY